MPTDISDDPTTDAVIDAVGGILDEVAKRRAEREQMKSKEAPDTPDQDRPARRFLKKLLDAGNNEASDDIGEKISIATTFRSAIKRNKKPDPA